mgnify:CR=1 FL=1
MLRRRRSPGLAARAVEREGGLPELPSCLVGEALGQLEALRARDVFSATEPAGSDLLLALARGGLATGLLGAGAQAMTPLGLLVIGPLSDRFGRRPEASRR